MTQSLSDAQQDMRDGYGGGAPGIVVSGLVWLSAAVVAFVDTPPRAIWALLIGGMAIHPLGVVLCKVLGYRGNHAPGNPLAGLAAASTVWLILSLPLAYAAGVLDARWFFPAMLGVIGSRYLVFATLFGRKAYWVLGALLAAAGVLLGWRPAPVIVGALAGGLIEVVVGLVFLARHRREQTDVRGDAEPAAG